MASSVSAQSKQLVQSRTYLYPLRGISYLLSHSSLWPPVTRHLPSLLLLSTGVLVFMFAFTYLPQVAVLAIFNGPLAFVNAAGLVLSESQFIINTIANAFIIEDSIIDLFDATLIEQGQSALVSRGRELKPAVKKTAYQRLGKIVTAPLHKLSPESIAMYLISLPLNLVPVVGTAAFILLQGRRAGPRFHGRYFQLKGLSGSQRDEFVSTRRGAYTGFGAAAVVLNLIPFVAIPFAFTHAVGAALWAADMEKQHAQPMATDNTVGTTGKDNEEL
ncbi:hypothetical protein BKA62DRAFT_706658 [Auriculariales sp. MPI-PUGE-AT-0066]|nr:hypothetical protein BKA62DRAFT_706658 [Auriculariales sp. MPI-PUGE-AT-0066]